MPDSLLPTPVKVLLVDDSAIVRGMLRNIIEQDKALTIIGTAGNGKIGVEQYKTLRPHVVVMDIEMPEMDGLTALREILLFDPNARVIMCSSLTQSGTAATIKALNIGAVDCMAKPTSTSIDRSQNFEEQLVSKLKAVSTGIREKETAQRPVRSATQYTVREYPPSLAVFQPQVLAIGSSTGGPKALTTLLPSLNKSLPLPPILITQHMPVGFTKMLADSIEKACGIKTYEAEHDMLVKPKTIYIAPGGKHMTVEKRTAGVFIALNDGPPVNFCKPAVDVMMDSILRTYQTGILSVILTGMGSDGFEGCKRIVESSPKNLLLSQDEATSVVWGMPAAVAKAGISNSILPIESIGPAINKLMLGQHP